LDKNRVTVQNKKMNLLENIDQNNIPNHLAIIMDGNGRWAKQQGLLRAFGRKWHQIS
jgi:undecaprenyl diphosphate synthase